MSEYFSYCTYVESEGERLFTMVFLPSREGKFPAIIYRTPYADGEEFLTDAELMEDFVKNHRGGLDSGYAFIYQHCRGRGKSSGDFIPYLHEREDTKALYQWIREQDFYDGNLFLTGGSYTSSVHFAAAPFDEDIKGAVLCIQDCERYNINYRNGIAKTGMHLKWYTENYKKKSRRKTVFDEKFLMTRPFSDFCKVALGEEVESKTEYLFHPDKNDPFWQTRNGGGDAHEAVKHANIPILIITGAFDIYGKIHDMWRGMDEETKSKSALIVHPNCHRIYGEDYHELFPCGDVKANFGGDQTWFDHILYGKPLSYETGKVTYYSLFENRWKTDDYIQPEKELTFTLGEGEKSYCYDPLNPARFKGGLTNGWDGSDWQYAPNSRPDIISVYTEDFAEDTVIKGKMKARLTVKSDCEDTGFYMRISIRKPEGDFGLRDDITKISNFNPDYMPGEEAEVQFSFDDISFMVKKGEALRIDISSSCFPTFLPHTNFRGEFAAQTETRVAKNTLFLDKSSITVFTE